MFVHNSDKCWPIFKIFSIGLISKFATRLMSCCLTHLKCAITLPCEIQDQTTNTLDVFNTISLSYF